MQNRTLKERMLDVVMAIGIWLVIIAAAVLLVYILTGALDDANTLRWWAASATVAVPVVGYIAWRLAAQASREHLAGFDRGIDKSEAVMTTVGRGLASAASVARAAAKSPAAVESNDDALLPRVGRMRIIDAPRSNGEIVE